MLWSVTKVIKLVSPDPIHLIAAINRYTEQDYTIQDKVADQIILQDRHGLTIEERINKRQMCNGSTIYTFEYLEEVI
jgi:hypothetical protein